jgi:hypothetical protein
MAVAWRFVVLAGIIFWVGGFTFYTSVVVPIGTEHLGRVGQGLITMEVTQRINAAGTISLALLLADLALTRGFRRSRAALWLLMALAQAALFALHGHLSGQIDLETHSIRGRPSFYQWHRLYLWIHTVQWAAALASLALLLASWGKPSGASGKPGPDGPAG